MAVINLPTHEQFDELNTQLASIAANVEPAVIINNLTTGGTTVALSAEQGKELKADIGNQTYTEDNYITDSEPLTESVDKLDMAVKDNADLISTNKDDLVAHKTDIMPHQITNFKTGKTYRYGYQISADGIPQVISEEVV